MSTSAQTADNGIETYLARLDAALAGVALPEKDEILREIRAHVLDSVADSTDRDAAVDRVLRLLGAPEQLAERYGTECQLTRASGSFSPWLLLRTSWRWARLGMIGTIAFVLGLLGYSLALGLTITLLLKPVMPSRVGLWLGSGNLFLGVPANRAGMHEVLGQWFVPVVALVAFATAIGTTSALRWLMRKRPRNPAYQVSQTTV
ncbi:MAG TPA: hypothetical protein VFF64_27495 [Candidatus Eremiobacteraceae bacterium]|nr:hypothetical protein [Candidatus Eremiobacteraceae bacterium]